MNIHSGALAAYECNCAVSEKGAHHGADHHNRGNPFARNFSGPLGQEVGVNERKEKSHSNSKKRGGKSAKLGQPNPV